MTADLNSFMPVAIATPVVFVVRIYDQEFDRDSVGIKLTDFPYAVACTVILVEGVATIEGFSMETGFKIAYRTAIFKELKRAGAEEVRWVRVKDGKMKELRYSLKNYA